MKKLPEKISPHTNDYGSSYYVPDIARVVNSIIEYLTPGETSLIDINENITPLIYPQEFNDALSLKEKWDKYMGVVKALLELKGELSKLGIIGNSIMYEYGSNIAEELQVDLPEMIMGFKMRRG